MQSSLFATILALLVSTSPVAARATLVPQDPPSGLLLGAPLGITSSVDGQIAVKTAGFEPPPGSPSDPARPDFEHLVARITPDAFAPHVPLLAMSLGIDVIAVRDTPLRATDFPEEPGFADGDFPVLQVGPHGWYAILFSVDSAQIGPLDGLAPDIANAGSERDRSVFCYVLPTSAAEMLPVEQQSVRVLRPDALGLRDPAELHALNMHMALYSTDLDRYRDVFTTQPLSPTPDVYFTLDVASWTEQRRNELRDAWGVEVVASDVIFRTRWNGSRWERPVLYQRVAALNLKVDPDEAVDGLAIDTKGTPDVRDDEMLLSLREDPPSALAKQILHVTLATKDPRPVVVRRRGDGGYGSLGREMRGGRSIGDFCTADPWAARADRGMTVFSALPLLDDFLIARRLPADDPHVARHASGWNVAGWVGIEEPSEPPFGSLPVETPFSLPRRLPNELPRRDGVTLFPHGDGYVQLAALDLSVAGYRFSSESRPHMRSCMSWARPRSTTGTAVVRWGVVQNYTEPLVEGSNLRWDGSQSMPWSAASLVFDRLLPGDGALPPRNGGFSPADATSSSHPPAPTSRKAFVMQWALVADGRSWISPIAALRY